VSVLRFRSLLPWLALAAAACGGEPRAPGAIVDDDGHRVVLAQPAQRIVSLSPSTTELLFAIGAGPQVVGRTRWCDYPPQAAQVPSVGDGLNPNLEAVLAQKPDLVVFYRSLSNRWVIARLDGLNVPSVSVRLDRLDDLPRAARLLGQVTGTSGRADSLAAAFAAQLDSARAAAAAASSSGVSAPSSASAPSGSPRVVVMAWENPPIAIGGGSFLSELLMLAGARNVFEDTAEPSLQTSVEAIAARDPDVVMVLGDSVPGALTGRPEWRAVGAVKRRSFLAVSGSEFERPSPRAVDAVRTLRAKLAGVEPR
jgi:ABC-type Fe3+-hydroxamate transport system substrate-binding protein